MGAFVNTGDKYGVWSRNRCLRCFGQIQLLYETLERTPPDQTTEKTARAGEPWPASILSHIRATRRFTSFHTQEGAARKTRLDRRNYQDTAGTVIFTS